MEKIPYIIFTYNQQKKFLVIHTVELTKYKTQHHEHMNIHHAHTCIHSAITHRPTNTDAHAHIYTCKDIKSK